MRERKAERYASTEEIVKEVNAAGRNQYLCIVACVLVLLAGVYAALKSPLYVLRGAKKVYEQTFGWDRFDRIKEL